MKPICLKIAGLNSFREVQEIDFTKLCETGVFGIFGSTGSGKSTILDAITLALYGTVERAANNTQGILNHSEEKLSVEYTFSLAIGSQRIIYRAERAYRRSGDRTVKASICRLVKIIGDSESVLASKADEMTKKIEEMLGLTVDDFTRAVVLPQGKFAEFLTIKPKDRRVMLERLFSLEAYGRDLAARLSEQLESTRFHLNGVEQRLQGLGDASQEQVKAAEEEYEAAKISSEQIYNNLSRLKQEFEEAKELWGLQEQLHQIREKESQRFAVQEDMKQIADRLSSAERAEPLRQVLVDLDLSEKRWHEAHEQANEAGSYLNQVRLKKEGIEEQWLEKNRRRLEMEPLYLRQVEQLEQAQRLEIDIQTRNQRLMETRHSYSELDQTRKRLEQALQELMEKKKTLENSVLEEKDKLSKISVDPARRQQINSSAQALEAYEFVSKQVCDLQRGMDKNSEELKSVQAYETRLASEVKLAQEAVENLKSTLAMKLQDPPLREDILRTKALDLERFRHCINNIERAEREELEEQERLKSIALDYQRSVNDLQLGEKVQNELLLEVQKLKDVVELKKRNVKEFEHRDFAGLLVDSLAEGEPCPVCGSAHHPRLAEKLQDGMIEEANRELDQAVKHLQTIESQEMEEATRLAVIRAQLATKKELHQNQSNLIAVKQRALAEYRQELLESNKNLELLQLKKSLVEQEEDLLRLQQQLNNWNREQEELKFQLEQAQSKLTEVEEQQYKLLSKISALNGVRSEIQNRLNYLVEERSKLQAQLDKIRGDIQSTEIRGMQQQISIWDQNAKIMNQKINSLEDNLRQTDENQQRLLNEKASCDLELQNLRTLGIEAARTLSELKIQCDSLTNGKPALERIEEVKQDLAQVVAVEERLKKEYELAREVLSQSEQTAAVSGKALELAKENLKLVQLKLEKGLKSSQFKTSAEVRSALCDPSDRLTLEQSLSEYQKEGLLLDQKRGDIEGRLQGQSLRPEEWLAWPVRLNAIEREYTETVEKRGASQQRLKKLKEEHEEWVCLDNERKTFGHRLDLLKNLQSVFKGNGFIEFLAQEQLVSVSRDASERLKQLTNQRYALEVDSEGGFIMRDDANGGVRRPVNSLSGGETFLTALALSLALSTQIQLRGESPLEFFFLDEGFGTLDANLLEIVMNTLEKLHVQNITIGIISHVPELRNRLARRLIVSPAEAGGVGSRVKLEIA